MPVSESDVLLYAQNPERLSSALKKLDSVRAQEFLSQLKTRCTSIIESFQGELKRIHKVDDYQKIGVEPNGIAMALAAVGAIFSEGKAAIIRGARGARVEAELLRYRAALEAFEVEERGFDAEVLEPLLSKEVQVKRYV